MPGGHLAPRTHQIMEIKVMCNRWDLILFHLRLAPLNSLRPVRMILNLGQWKRI